MDDVRLRLAYLQSQMDVLRVDLSLLMEKHGILSSLVAMSTTEQPQDFSETIPYLKKDAAPGNR